MRLFWALVLWMSVLFAPALADNTFPADAKGIGEWMSYYYVEKNSARFGDFVHWLESSHFLETNPGAEPPTVAFISAVFAETPANVRSWASSEQFTGKARNAIERSLWISHHSELIGALFHEKPDYAAKEAHPMLTLPLNSPDMFDMMWATFFATGDVRYPARLVDILDESAPITGDRLRDVVYRQTAAWSLSSNLHQHELILRMVRAEASKRTGSVQQKLNKMLSDFASERKGFADCTEEFCAILVLTSEGDLKEFAKPSNQGVYLTQLSKAKTGDHVAIKLAFAGMALADNLMADVTFDLKIVAPGGADYEVPRQNLEAIRRKVPLRFRVFDNNAVVILRFAPSDRRGTYTVVAVIKDNIGQRRLSLSKQIKLMD